MQSISIVTEEMQAMARQLEVVEMQAMEEM
jgi:hypothetical protein